MAEDEDPIATEIRYLEWLLAQASAPARRTGRVITVHIDLIARPEDRRG
jgi:hypothetical protein